MNGKKLFLLLLPTYAALTVMLSLFDVTPALTGLSTVLGTTIFSATVLGSSLLTTTKLVAAYNHALLIGQVAIGVSAIGFLFFHELSDRRYGRTHKRLVRLRESWFPVSVSLLILLCAMVIFKISGLF